MIRRPPKSTLFPSTPLFRSEEDEPVTMYLRKQGPGAVTAGDIVPPAGVTVHNPEDRKSTRLNSSHANISYAVFCLKKKKHRLPRNNTHTEIYTSPLIAHTNP